MEIVELTEKEISYFNLVKFWQGTGHDDMVQKSAEGFVYGLSGGIGRADERKRALRVLGVEVDTLWP